MKPEAIAEVNLISKQLTETLKQASDKSSEGSADGYLARGKIYQSAGLLQSAIKCYEVAAYLESSPEALGRLSLCHLMEGKVEAALDTAVKLCGLDRTYRLQTLATDEQIGALAILGDALLLSNREEQAEAAYKDALKVNAKDSYAAGRLGYLLLAQGKADEATRLQKTIGRNPRFGDLQDLLRLSQSGSAAVPLLTMDRVRSFAELGVPGRPFRVNGNVRVAPGVPGERWLTAVNIECDHLNESDRERIGLAWEKAGRDEHASLAAFSQFIMQMLSLGAPPELVADASRALQEEIQHAKLSLGIASALLRRPTDVGPLNLSGVLVDKPASAVLHDTIIGGCLGEAIAAAEAEEGARSTKVPEIREFLLQVTEEESRHANLAWRFVEWLLHQRPELALVARDAFAAVSFELPQNTTEDGSLFASYGLLPEQAKYEIAKRVFEGHIRPRVTDLLSKIESLYVAA